MTEIAFFGHDAGDAAIQRRVAAFQAVGHKVTGFMMRRGEDCSRDWENIDLGQTFDAAYWQRLRAIFKGAAIAAQHIDQLERADLFYARNLDMLICMMRVVRKLKLQQPVIYECLDVHHLLTREDPFGQLLRGVERKLLVQTNLLVYSSPAFEREFYRKKYKNLYTPYLLENRLVDNELLPRRHPAINVPRQPLRIGWFGVLRCNRSLDLLAGLAQRYPEQVQVVTAGIPALTQVPDFHQRIDALPNMSYGGPYKAPQDLPGLYESVDTVWAGDFYQAGYNSKWLLPNRLYEGGYFSVPPIAPAGSETGQWVERHNSGFTIEEPLDKSLAALVDALLANPGAVREKSVILSKLPDVTFVQPRDEILKLVEAALVAKAKVAA